MRSLAVLDVGLRAVVDVAEGGTVCALTTDPASLALFALAQQPQPDGTATLLLYSLPQTGTSGLPAPIATWAAESAGSFARPDANPVIAFKYLQENDSLSLVLANGDIEQLIEPSNEVGLEQRRENVGAVDVGIKAAVWSPDEELLALVTGDDKLVVMTKEFEVLSEGPLRTTDFGEDAPVNVGWGEKSTQFHGSVGKSAAAVPSSSTSPLAHLSSLSDDGLPRLSWRGDSAFFTVSSVEPLPTPPSTASAPTPSSTPERRRTLRIFSRVGVLSSTSEPTNGLEHPLAWQPTGSIIAATQKRISGPDGEGSHHVVFFERNGLRRYEFALRETEMGASGSEVRELAWNAESTLLAVWIERREGHVVQIWHRNNYHWYLKQELSPRLSGSRTITSLLWHPENGLDLYLTTTSGVETFSLCWDTFSSHRPPPNDDGSVAVVDGSTLNLTPFRLVNIPPPMSATSVTSTRPSRVPVHIAFSLTSHTFVSLYPDGFVELWNWNLELNAEKARGAIEAPVLAKSFEVSGEAEGWFAKQCAYVGEGKDLVVGCLLAERIESVLLLVGANGETRRVAVPGGARRVVAAEEGFVLESDDGTIQYVPASAPDGDVASPSPSLASLPAFCPWILPVSFPTTPSSTLVIGLTSSGRLYAGPRQLASDATSFTLTSTFLIFTTFSHEAKFLSLLSLAENAGTEDGAYVESLRRPPQDAKDEGVRRAVERGSRIVAVVESSTSLVLQMPRGNLETVFPRPLVLRIVRQDLDGLRYRTAFLACRRHRIDLNILHDHDPEALLSHLPEFVLQIKSVEYLNLFLSGLKNEDVTATMYRPLVSSSSKPFDASEKINTVCDLVRKELETRDVFHYANTILTAHVRKQPPDYESALRVLVDLKARDAERAEEAVKYIIFLSDANKLFDLALGLYNFPLVLLIAQHSQKDPREYLPFLRQLRSLDTHLQRFTIDDHLERNDSALRNLAKAGPEKFDEVVEYVKRHELFATALEIYRDEVAKYKIILVANAAYLMEHRKPAEAGLLFSLGGQPAQAMKAYEKANAWQELFTLALTDGKRPASEIKVLAVEVAENLKSKRRFLEAGRVLLEYGRDVEAAVSALVEGTAFVEAIRLTSLYTRRDLIETHIKPATLEVQTRIVDDIEELTQQVEKQVERLAELKDKRDANPNQYFCVDVPTSAMDNVELQPDGASDAGTAFTRYTTAGGSVATTQMSSRTSRSRRRGVLKKAAGKKGSIYEESYLLRSLKKSYESKLEELQTETAALVPVLLSLSTTQHRSAATTLHEALATLEGFLEKQLDIVWIWREAEWAKEKEEEVRAKDRGEVIERKEVEEGTERVERPKLAGTKWRSSLLGAL